MIEIPLTKGLVALVDDEDEWLLEWRWQALKPKPGRNSFYAVRGPRGISSSGQSKIYMHREIIGHIGLTAVGFKVDHRNNNGLDNQRHNLRVSTTSQNGANQQRLRSDNTSGFKGVSWNKREKKYRAYIVVNKQRYELGSFVNAVDAARAYDEAALFHFGEFAALNKERNSEVC